MQKQLGRKLSLAVCLLSVFLMLGSGCSPKPGPAEPPNGNLLKDKTGITNILNSNPDIVQVTWSPAETTVLYIQKGKADQPGKSAAYAWKVNEEQPRLLEEVSPEFRAFTWSPNSKYFLISEKSGEEVLTLIYNAETFSKETPLQLKSSEVPVWSADSQFLAYGFEQHDYGDSWGSLKVYQIGQPESEYLWRAKDRLYQVEFWDAAGNIGYIETDAKGKQTRKTAQNIRPSISGVRLGDNREQVQAALGLDYTETPPSEEFAHYPEPVYRWTYEEGYEVFIGENTGKVWQIWATAAAAETNLGVKMGDTAARVWEIYRPKYIEPESIHGGLLIGVFKVEGAAVLSFGFDTREGAMRTEIKSQNRVVNMNLTYPNILDDDF
jgi:hypothetical protein